MSRGRRVPARWPGGWSPPSAAAWPWWARAGNTPGRTSARPANRPPARRSPRNSTLELTRFGGSCEELVNRGRARYTRHDHLECLRFPLPAQDAIQRWTAAVDTRALLTAGTRSAWGGQVRASFALAHDVLEHSLPQQVEFCPPIHAALEQLESVHLAFRLPLAVGQREGGQYGLQILSEFDGEGRKLRHRACACFGEPLLHAGCRTRGAPLAHQGRERRKEGERNLHLRM